MAHTDKLNVKGAIVTTPFNLNAHGKMKLVSSREEVDIDICIKGTLRHVGSRVYESDGIEASFRYDNLNLELTGTIKFELDSCRRLHSIAAEFCKVDYNLRVKKQEAKWHGLLMELDPFSFILRKESKEIGRGTFQLSHETLFRQLSKIIMR